MCHASLIRFLHGNGKGVFDAITGEAATAGSPVIALDNSGGGVPNPHCRLADMMAIHASILRPGRRLLFLLLLPRIDGVLGASIDSRQASGISLA